LLSKSNITHIAISVNMCYTFSMTDYGKIFTKELLLELYVNQRLFIKDIAKEYNCQYRTVSIYLKKYNIDRFLRYEELTEQENFALRGMAFGDGYICHRNDRKYSHLKIVHTLKQNAYLQYKLGFVKKIVDKSLDSYKVFDTRTNKEYSSVGFTTISHPVINEIYNDSYSQNKKIISKVNLNKMNDLSLALIFCDDGTCSRDRNQMSLATDCFSSEENELMAEWFQEKWNIKANITMKNYNQTRYHYLSFYGNNCDILSDIIRPYIIPEMLYKIK